MSLWPRVRKARLVQVLLVYLGASWLILQVTNELRETLQLPGWVSPVTLLLLIVGLLIIGATAWVQSHPLTDQREAADEVPGSWELALGELKGSVARGEVPHLTWGRAILGGVVAFSMLFGFAGLYVLVQDRGRSFAPEPAVAGEAGPGLAVLPFAVSGEGFDAWRDGLVGLLAANLDGAGGLRAIDSRTLMARWRETVGDGTTADLHASLEVARRSGARYAAVGSASGIGPAVRLVVDLYRVGGEAKLGQVRVEGSPDSVLSLVDRLSVDVLRVLLPEEVGELPTRTLSAVTTASLPALKAYMEGEALFRRSDFPGAIAAFERAVAADSTFALAHYRLSMAYGWSRGIEHPGAQENIARAALRADRLPERTALLVKGSLALMEGSLAGVAPLREAVRRYPDDVEAWYLLGDTYTHLGTQALVERRETERALTRALELDPSFAPSYIHLVEMALGGGDSVQARGFIEAYEHHAPGTREGQTFDLAFDLVFGDSAARRRRLDELFGLERISGSLYQALDHPRAWDVGDEVFGIVAMRPEPSISVLWQRYKNHVRRGHVRAALESVDGVPVSLRAEAAWEALQLGVDLPAERLERDLPADTAGADPVVAFFAALHAADRGRWSDHQRLLAWFEGRAEGKRAEGDSAAARFETGVASAVEAYGLWKRGRAAEALPLFEGARTAVTGHTWAWVQNWVIRRSAGLALVELGRDREAEPYLRSITVEESPREPWAYLELARLYDRLGEDGKAREAYEFVLGAWSDPDPELEPLVEEVRAALMRLTAAEAA